MKFGILGGGQLAWMLWKASQKLELDVEIYAQSPQDPIFQESNAQIHLGALDDTEKMQEFLKNKDIVTFESEFLDCQFLQKACANLKVKVLPSLDCISILQDKLKQKTTIKNLQLPSAEFEIIKNPQELNEIKNKYTDGFVLKWSRLGYDGKGVLLCPVKNPPNQNAIDKFFLQAQKNGSDVYAEQFVDYQSECAMVCSRSESGKIIYFPLVLSQQSHGVCFLCRGPALEFGISKKVEIQAQQICKILGNHHNIIGTFAVEFFLDKKENLLINEIAPRVHNSGHYTQDACDYCQFTTHWLALQNKELPTITLHKPFFAMVNVLGPQNCSPQKTSTIAQQANSKLHWYGKTEIRSLRKMGHINITANSKEELEENISLSKHNIEKWYTNTQHDS